jgi:hypothetical protein
MDGCSKLYCKTQNLLKVVVKGKEYSFEGERVRIT